MLSVKQGGIKYHFLSLWYDSIWDRTQVSRAIGEHYRTLPKTTEINVIISNKNHPKSISPLLYRVGTFVAPTQDNLNLLLCLHLNRSSLRSSLRSLKLFIIVFSSIHKLHLPLKVFAVEDCLTIFHFIWGLAPDPKSSKKI